MADIVLYELAQRAGRALEERGWRVTTAESCTGGWVSEAITMVPGSSAWFERGFVTYTYISEREMPGVKSETLAAQGAVSEAGGRERVQGALKASHARVALAVSDTAGPGGGPRQTPVGGVCFAWALEGAEPRAETLRFAGDGE